MHKINSWYPIGIFGVQSPEVYENTKTFKAKIEAKTNKFRSEQQKGQPDLPKDKEKSI